MATTYGQRYPHAPQQYMNPRPPHGYAAAGPPLDDVEHWFIQPVPNNRMVLALESGIISEVSWSLNRLLRVSASDRFHIQLFPTLPALLCQWPEWFLEHIDDEDHSTFSPSPTYTINRRLALNSLLVLKNAALNDTVLKHPTITDDAPTFLAKMERVRTLVFRILEIFGPRMDDSVQEAVLTALDLFRYTIQKWPAPPTFEQTQAIVSIVGRSNDRAVLIAGWSGLYNLLDTFTHVTHVTPQSEALEAAIRVLPVYVDTQMSFAALDYILAHLSNPSLAKAFLHHRSMPQVLRMLAQRLLFDQQKLVETVTVTLGAPPRTMIAQNNAIGFIELTREELDEMSTLTEPSRVTKWMQRMFDVSPRAEMTQVDFWNLYKGAFAVYGTDNMLPATDLIKLVTTVFPAAMAMVIPGANGKPPKFVIKGLERKRAAAEGRTKCHWDKWGCPEPAFGTPAELSAHVRSHLMLNPTTKCRWGSCTHSSPTVELFERHLWTHLPLPDMVHIRHPGQVDDVMVPPGMDVDADMGMPTTRPVPPVPPIIMTYPKPREDPPSTSFSALLIMRILYRTSFAQAEVVMKTDGDHFGFPGVEQNVGKNGEEEVVEGKDDGIVVQEFGYDSVEGQRKGKDAFKAIGSMLASVQIHDSAIMAWIDEMTDSIKALPILTL